MATIHDQLAWEELMVQHGVDRYRAQQDAAAEGERPDETSAGSRLLRAYVLQISDHLRLYLAGNHPDGRRRSKYAKLVETINTDKTAMVALKAVIASMYNPQSLQTLFISVGRSVEDELRFTKFHAEHGAYYDEIIRAFERRGSENKRYKQRSLSDAASAKFEWVPWSKEVRLGVGGLVLSLLTEVCDLVERKQVNLGRNRKEVLLVPTQTCLDWVLKHNADMELTNPDRMPCLVAPADWTRIDNGGYYSPLVRSRTQLVKIRGGGSDATERRAAFNSATMPAVYDAVNAMQRTRWSVNTRVLAVMQEVWRKNLSIGMPPSEPYSVGPSPLAADADPRALAEDSPELAAFNDWKAEAREVYTIEKQRVSKILATARTIRMAVDMSAHSEFYYVYQCDFRGRVYAATSGLSPQGTDHGKALLQFTRGEPLGARGLYWLKVHGANKYGEDKSSYDARVAWIDAQHEQWLLVADDPIAYRDYWKDADKPYQFLAFCFEYAEASRVGAAFRSRLPVALDGSCNGLQHFSAMLRDEVGGRAVNLTPSEVPADIYQEVANVCTRKLIGLRSLNTADHGAAVNWLALFADTGTGSMPRALSKKPVMTLPYGSTRQACTDSVFQWSFATAPDFFEKSTGFRHALYLSPLLWDSIGETVVAARAAMDWVQACAGILAKANLPVQYTSYLGFPVLDASFEFETRCIETHLSGRLQLRIANDTDQLSVRKQRQSSSPNLIHHVDATHLMMCVNAGTEYGIEDFAMIHDDFGVHACQIDAWHSIIREQFITLHTELDVLASFKAVHEARHEITLPALPARGRLDINAVRHAAYFFG